MRCGHTLAAGPRARCRAGRRRGWLATVPEPVRSLERLWSLDVGDPVPAGRTHGVGGTGMGAEGEQLVLKVAWPHPEAAHEADGLRWWDG